MKKSKKILAMILACTLCLSQGAILMNSRASGERPTTENLNKVMGKTYISYEMANINQGDAQGVVKFHFGELAKDAVTSILYYWVDSDGNNLEGYYHIMEFGEGFKSAISSTKNSVAEAENGFTFQQGAVIPYGAAGLKAVVTITLDDDSKVEKTVTDCEYITMVNGVQATDTTLPQYKKAVMDYTTDIDGEEVYQMFYLSDFHNYYGWDSTKGETYTTNTTVFVSDDGKSGSPQGKAVYGINKILEEDDKTIGIITTGDILNDSSNGRGDKGFIARGDYNSVLATYYQGGLMKYLNFFTNGNHDLVKAYTSQNGNQHMEFLANVYQSNKILLDAGKYAKVTGYEEPADYYYDFFAGRDHYIILSSPYEAGAYGTEQLTWLEALISADDASDSEVRTFIISHEPIYNAGIYATGSYMNDDQQVKGLIEAYSVNHKVVWISGHTHISYIDNIKNMAIGLDSNVSYIGLPYVLDTGLHSKRYYEAQGMQMKVYKDKLVMIGRILFDGSTYRTEAMPSAMYVIDYAEDVEVPAVSVEETGAKNNILTDGSVVRAVFSATNGTETYQWYAGGVAIEGATSAAYTIGAATPEGRLSVEVKTSDGGVYYGVAASRIGAIHIRTAEQLKMIGQEGYPLDGSYILDCDIDLGGEDWTPLAYNHSTKGYQYKTDTSFSGVLDGNGYTIRNMKAVSVDASHSYAGLFGVVSGNAQIKNIRFENCNVTATAGVSAYAGVVAGGFYPAPAGESLDNGVKVTNVAIENCIVVAKGRNLNNQITAGSVVGYGFCATLTDVWSDADVVALYNHTDIGVSKQVIAGGIVGSCYTGNANHLKMTNCMFAGTVDASRYYNKENGLTEEEQVSVRTGAMLGANTRGMQNPDAGYPSRAVITNCYYVSDYANVNTDNLRASNGTIKTAQELSSLVVEDLLLDSAYWFKGEALVKLKISPEYSSEVIKIYSVNELSKIGKSESYPLDASYMLMKDIDMSAYGNWTPIGYYIGTNAPSTSETLFTGIFDGNGHTIFNLSCNVDGGTGKTAFVSVGLFGTLKDAVVKNLRFVNCSFEAIGGGQGVYAGVVAGTTASTTSSNSQMKEYEALISNVMVETSTVNATMINQTSIMAASGGLVGFSDSGVRIQNCLVDADITGEVQLEAAGESNQIAAGGLVGASYSGKVWAANCIITGTLNTKYYTEGVTPTAAYQRQNSVLGLNSRAIANTAYDNGGVARATNCYYYDTLNVNGGNPRGVDAVPISEMEFAIRGVEAFGMDPDLWIHTGYKPVLKICGEEKFNGLPDVNTDGRVDIRDLVKLVKFEDNNATEGVFYRAANLIDDKVIDKNDIAALRQYLIGSTYIPLDEVMISLNQTNAAKFKLLGNTAANVNEFYMDYSYTGFAFEAYTEGNVTVDFRYSNNNSSFTYAKLAVIVDGGEPKIIEIREDGTYTIANVTLGNHTFEVIKITERTHDILKADKLSLKGVLKAVPADKELKMQFIGDSITAASGIVSYIGGNSDSEQAAQNILQGYAYQTAKNLDADLAIRARSGIKTGLSATALLPNKSVGGQAVIVEDDNYDIVVIGLGTNDNIASGRNTAEGLTNDVTKMLTNARIAYPSAKIVWIYGMMIQTDNDIIKGAIDAFNSAYGDNVYYFDGFTANNSGGSGHPNAAAHTRAAGQLADYVANTVLK